MQHCSLQHWILLSSQTYPRHHVCFSPVAAFFLELLVIVLCSSQIAYWTTSNLGGSSLGVIFFCLFIQFMGFSWQIYWSSLPFPPLVDHLLSELFTMTCSTWVTLDGMAHSFTELYKPLCHEKAVIHVQLRLLLFY